MARTLTHQPYRLSTLPGHVSLVEVALRLEIQEEKIRGQSVDISKEKGPQILAYEPFSCLKTWCRRSESN